MTSTIRTFTFAVVLACFSIGSISIAEDFDSLIEVGNITDAACDSSGGLVNENFEESGDPFFRETSNHPGLLGKPYIDVRYLHFQDDELQFAPGFDDSLQGVQVSANVPLTVFDESSGPFHFDLYSEFIFASLNSSGNLGPEYNNVSGEVDVEARMFGIGISAFVELTNSIRPFIQLGYEYFNVDARLTVAPVSIGIDESDNGLLLNFGTEVDIAKRLAARVTIDLNTVDEVLDSRAITELIFWPFRRVYLRGGIDVPLDAANVGGLIGAGVTF